MRDTCDSDSSKPGRLNFEVWQLVCLPNSHSMYWLHISSCRSVLEPTVASCISNAWRQA